MKSLSVQMSRRMVPFRVRIRCSVLAPPPTRRRNNSCPRSRRISKPCQEASAHPKTAEWWASQPDAWAACRANLESPQGAMARYLTWVRSLSGRPVFVAYPAGFDFLFVYWYLMRFVGESPFGHSALDIKSFAMAVLKVGYRESTKRNIPKRWFDK